MEDPALSQRSLLARIWGAFVSGVRRSKVTVIATALTFFGVIFVSVAVTVFAFSYNPGLADVLEVFVSEQQRQFAGVPEPYTGSFFSFILLNNVGHFWDPFRMLVWVPLLGALVLGFELLLNGVLIGVVATLVGFQRGVAFPVLGLVPHGVFEIPAFVFEFVSIVRWHVTVVEAVMAKVSGEGVNVAKFKLGVRDVVVLAVVSVVLFVVAAFVETFVTPRLLGL